MATFNKLPKEVTSFADYVNHFKRSTSYQKRNGLTNSNVREYKFTPNSKKANTAELTDTEVARLMKHVYSAPTEAEQYQRLLSIPNHQAVLNRHNQLINNMASETAIMGSDAVNVGLTAASYGIPAAVTPAGAYAFKKYRAAYPKKVRPPSAIVSKWRNLLAPIATKVTPYFAKAAPALSAGSKLLGPLGAVGFGALHYYSDRQTTPTGKPENYLQWGTRYRNERALNENIHESQTGVNPWSAQTTPKRVASGYLSALSTLLSPQEFLANINTVSSDPSNYKKQTLEKQLDTSGSRYNRAAARAHELNKQIKQLQTGKS